ncbi:MAG: iron-containing alcohol dehydrogenase [Bacillota bacterium]|nr:iron-containing alcohol dehydrogenase [Bacillota bacterium]
MATYVFEMPTKIMFGSGSVAQVGVEAAKLGTKAIIVTYPDIRRIGLLDEVISNLRQHDVRSVVFDKVEPNPRASTTDAGAELARREGIDLVIGLGGGSAMDAAKGVAIAASGISPVWDYVAGKAQVTGTLSPVIQVPTMAGTGSEINAGAIITNWETHVKSSLRHPQAQARVAIVDPRIHLSVPLRQTKAGGVDIFSHLVEGYVIDGAPSPLTDGIRETCMKMVVKYLPLAIEDLGNLAYREQLAWASTMAMSAFVRLGGGGGTMTNHGIEHAVSGYYDVVHGEGLAALLPAWMRSFARVRQDRFDKLAETVFGGGEDDGIVATEKWLENVGMRLRVRDLGCKLEDAEMIGQLAVESSPYLTMHPTPLDAPAVARIYREAW